MEVGVLSAEFEHQAMQKRVDLELKVEREMPAITITVDETRMAQVLGSNALHYTLEGSRIVLGAALNDDRVIPCRILGRSSHRKTCRPSSLSRRKIACRR